MLDNKEVLRTLSFKKNIYLNVLHQIQTSLENIKSVSLFWHAATDKGKSYCYGGMLAQFHFGNYYVMFSMKNMSANNVIELTYTPVRLGYDSNILDQLDDIQSKSLGVSIDKDTLTGILVIERDRLIRKFKLSEIGVKFKDNPLSLFFRDKDKVLELTKMLEYQSPSLICLSNSGSSNF